VFTPSLFNAAGLPAAPFAMFIGDDGKVQPGLASPTEKRQ